MTKTRKERIAEIEEISLKQQNWDYDGSNFDDAMKAGAENAEISMAQKALEIIRELEAELKVAITALRKIQNVSYPSSSVTWEDCCTAHEKCASEALCKLNN